MIEKEEYLKALEIVEEYHKQLSLQIVRHCDMDTNLSNVKVGDFIKVVKEVRPLPKVLTTGKSYEVIGDKEHYLNIRNDIGGSQWVPKTNTVRRWAVSCA